MHKEAIIRWIKKETRDTLTYALEVKEKFTCNPGQFNMLYVPGIGEAPISISSAPEGPELRHTVRIAGDVTTALSHLKIGDILHFRGPYGTGWPMEELGERTLIIVAGGLGIAPLRSVVRHLLRKKNLLLKRPFLLYGTKTPKDIIYRDEFPRFRDVFDIFLSVDRADPEMVWRGHVGLVIDLIDKITFDPLNSVAFLCGPEIMMHTTIEKLLHKGMPEEKIYLSMERNMNCGIGLCGHCMFGPHYVCKNGPVFRYGDVLDFLPFKEL
jgi:NAD(P)H-flavin reductase